MLRQQQPKAKVKGDLRPCKQETGQILYNAQRQYVDDQYIGAELPDIVATGIAPALHTW